MSAFKLSLNIVMFNASQLDIRVISDLRCLLSIDKHIQNNRTS